MKKLVLIHDNLPRVHKEIKTWNLTLRSSARYLTNPTTTTPDEDEEAEDAGSSEDEPDADPDEAANSSMADMFEDMD